jgi:hypothetical protein
MPQPVFLLLGFHIRHQITQIFFKSTSCEGLASLTYSPNEKFGRVGHITSEKTAYKNLTAQVKSLL